MAKDKLTISIESDLKLEAKIKALREGIDLSEIISELLREWLKDEKSS